MSSLGYSVCFLPAFASCLNVRCVATLSLCVDILKSLMLNNWTASFPLHLWHYNIQFRRLQRSPHIHLKLSKTSKKVMFSLCQMRHSRFIHFKDIKITCWENATRNCILHQRGVYPLKLLWASTTWGEKNKGADWQMTCYHKLKLEFKLLYLKHISEICTSVKT